MEPSGDYASTMRQVIEETAAIAKQQVDLIKALQEEAKEKPTSEVHQAIYHACSALDAMLPDFELDVVELE